jgi:hypothetical protein
MLNTALAITRRTQWWAPGCFLLYWLTTWGVTVASGDDRRLSVLLHLLLPMVAGALVGWWQWWQHIPARERFSSCAGVGLIVIEVDLAIAVVAEAVTLLAGVTLAGSGQASSFNALANQERWAWQSRLVASWAQFAVSLGLIGACLGALGSVLATATAAGIHQLVPNSRADR